MSYSEPLVNQVYRFALAVGLGVISGVVYELLTLFIFLFSMNKKAVFVRDLTFSVLFTLLAFFFLLVYNEGEVRLNIIAGHLSGLVVFHISIGKKMALPVERFIDKRKRIIKIKKYKKHKN